MPDGTATLALDTNLLAYSSSRRLLHGVALETGTSLVVLPEVYAQTLSRVGLIAESRWESELEEDARFADADKQRIVDAAAEGARAWFKGEMAREEGAFVPLEETLDQAWAARRIARNLPAGSIRRNDRLAEGDPLIIGQAITFDVTLLSTNNLRTIRHEPINAWVTSTLGRNQRLLYLPDETLQELSNCDRQQTYEWTIAYGAWPMQLDVEDESAVRESYEGAIERIAGAGFADTASEAQWDYEQDARFIARARMLLNLDEARSVNETERRLRERVLDNVMDAGWSRSGFGGDRVDSPPTNG